MGCTSSSNTKNLRKENEEAVELIDDLWDALDDEEYIEDGILYDPVTNIKAIISKLKEDNKLEIEKLKKKNKEITQIKSMKFDDIENVAENGIEKEELEEYILQRLVDENNAAGNNNQQNK